MATRIGLSFPIPIVLAIVFNSGFAAETEIPKSGVLARCANCHSERFLNPIYEEWRNSTHRQLVDADSPRSPARRDGCVKCHTAQGFAEGKTKAAEIANPLPQTCIACHSLENHGRVPGYVRIFGRITLPDKITIANAGTGAVCMTCHNSRRDVTNAQIFQEKRAPHGSPQADMLKGSGAFEVLGYRYSNSWHTTIENGCVACHMAQPPRGAQRIVGGHTFKVSSGEAQNTSACQGCHKEVEAFNRPALGDFDGDKIIEPVQDEVKGLLALLKETIESGMDGGKGGTLSESHGRVAFKKKDGEAIKPEDISEAQYIAAYNYFFVHNDKSNGIHNTAYAVQLLQSAYQNLTGKPIAGAYIR